MGQFLNITYRQGVYHIHFVMAHVLVEAHLI